MRDIENAHCGYCRLYRSLVVNERAGHFVPLSTRIAGTNVSLTPSVLAELVRSLHAARGSTNLQVGDLHERPDLKSVSDGIAKWANVESSPEIAAQVRKFYSTLTLARKMKRQRGEDDGRVRVRVVLLT